MDPLAGFRVAMIETAAGPVEVAEAGTGQAVLAIHGGMGGYDQGAILARAVLDHPARVLAPSRPGYLRTPLARRGTPDAQADLYAALLDARGIDAAVAVAVSAGGPSAIAFARRHPDRCKGLVLVSTVTGALAVPPGAARRLPMLRLIAKIPPLGALVTLAARMRPERAASRSILDPEIRRRTLAHPAAGPLLRALQESVASRLSRRLPTTLDDVATFQREAPFDIASVRVPVLAIHGAMDRVVPIAHMERVAAALPDAKTLAIPEGEHVCLVTHIDEVRAAVRGFMADR